MRHADEMLTRFDVAHESRVLSAHRTPALTAEYSSTAAGRGLQVIICGAGGAAHLAGASWLRTHCCQSSACRCKAR